MKKLKLSFVGLLSLIGLAATPTDSQAWGLLRDCFGCCCGNQLDRCSTYICCRPYNAFTPVCFGTITCNGCAPIMMQPPVVPNCGGWMPPPPYCCGPAPYPAACCDPCCGPCCGPTYSTGDGYGPGLPMDPNACAPQYGMPQHGAPQYGMAPHGAPQYGMPQHGAPQYGMPPQGAPQYGMPPQGAPQYGMPQHGMPPYAQPMGPPVGQPYAQPYPGLPIQQQNYTMPPPPAHTAGYQPGYQVPGYYVQPVSYYPMWPNQPVVPSYWYGR